MQVSEFLCESMKPNSNQVEFFVYCYIYRYRREMVVSNILVHEWSIKKYCLPYNGHAKAIISHKPPHYKVTQISSTAIFLIPRSFEPLAPVPQRCIDK